MELKRYPIDNTAISNKRKLCGAFGWHKNKVCRITSQNVGIDNCVIDNMFNVKKKSVRLVRVGSRVGFINLSILPPRCSEVPIQNIVEFLGNGLVRLSIDNDTTNSGHLKSA